MDKKINPLVYVTRGMQPLVSIHFSMSVSNTLMMLVPQTVTSTDMKKIEQSLRVLGIPLIVGQSIILPLNQSQNATLKVLSVEPGHRGHITPQTQIKIDAPLYELTTTIFQSDNSGIKIEELPP